MSEYKKMSLFVAVMFFFGIVVLVCFALNHNRLMDQCIADGHKEYECHLLLSPKQIVIY